MGHERLGTPVGLLGAPLCVAQTRHSSSGASCWDRGCSCRTKRQPYIQAIVLRVRQNLHHTLTRPPRGVASTAVYGSRVTRSSVPWRSKVIFSSTGGPMVDNVQGTYTTNSCVPQMFLMCSKSRQGPFPLVDPLYPAEWMVDAQFLVGATSTGLAHFFKQKPTLGCVLWACSCWNLGCLNLDASATQCEALTKRHWLLLSHYSCAVTPPPTLIPSPFLFFILHFVLHLVLRPVLLPSSCSPPLRHNGARRGYRHGGGRCAATPHV